MHSDPVLLLTNTLSVFKNAASTWVMLPMISILSTNTLQFQVVICCIASLGAGAVMGLEVQVHIRNQIIIDFLKSNQQSLTADLHPNTKGLQPSSFLLLAVRPPCS